MPYGIFPTDGKFEVMNLSSGKKHGATTKKKAEKQIRLLRGIERGWQPTGKKKSS